MYDRMVELERLEKEGAKLEKKAKEAREARNPFRFFKSRSVKNKAQPKFGGRTDKGRKKRLKRTAGIESTGTEEEKTLYSTGYDSL